MKNKAVSLLFCSLLAVLFCLIIENKSVKAWSYGDFDHSNPKSGQTIPAYETWNNYQQNQGQNAQPSSAVTNIYIAFGFYGGGDNDRCNNTIYFENPINDYSEFVITPTVYNGVTYNLRYPVAFINCYPADLTIPAGYNTYSDGSRSVIYPSSGKPIWSAFICGSTDSLMYLTNYEMAVNVNPLSSDAYSFKYDSFYYDNYVPTANYPFFWTKPHRNVQQGITNTSSIWCSYTDCPVFCDLYKALEYSENGVIDSSNEAYVLYGVDKAAVQPVTPTPSDSPSPTPTATPIPYPTSMEISGGNISIDNWPTPLPTATPTPTPTPVPYGDIFDDNVSDGGAISITGIDSSGLKDKIKNSIDVSDGFMPLHYPLEEIPGYTNGDSSNVFNNYPKAAMNYLTTAQTGEDSSFVGFLIQTTGIFSNGLSSSSGFSLNASSPLFWFLSAIVLMIFVTVLKKIL